MANSQNIPENVTSYDTGNKPYKHDVGRGKWSSKWDFYAIALSHCFGFRHLILHFFLSRSNAILLLLSYTIGMITFIIPIYYNQMFMGQFSSSGIISAFRIAPLFKGIGYVALAMNIFSCSYFMVTAAFPLYIVFESMQTYLPWTHCNNYFNTEYCVKIQPGEHLNLTYDAFENKSFPIHEYLDYLIREDDASQKWYFSWRIMLCILVVWCLVGAVLYKGVEILGKIFRFITIIFFICLLMSTIRIFCVAESWEILRRFFHIQFRSFNRIEILIASPLLTVSAFGAGWGNILTIASYNEFKEDIGKLTLNICLVQMFVFLILSVNFMAVDYYLEYHYGFMYLYYYTHDTMSYMFVTYAFFFSHLEWPHFWTIVFFFCLFLGQFSEGVLQILTILTGIFDEFEYTRIYKKMILGVLVGVLAVLSIPFCTTNAFSSITYLYMLTGATKLLIMFLELMAVVWIYGRLRFQRDVKFMTGKPIASWKVWMMRFLTPLLIAFAFLFYLAHGIFASREGFVEIIICVVVLKLFPIFGIPGYMIFKIYTATGQISERFKKLCRPNDWYPADPTEHQNYENYSGNSDMTNELVHVDMQTEVINF